MSGRILFFSAVMAGCVVDDVVDEENLGEVEQGIYGCPAWECGMNSPYLGRGFWNLPESPNETNDEGFHIVTFEKNGIPYQLDVENGKLLGRYHGVVALSYLNLVGATITIKNEIDQRVFVVKVAAVQRTYFWAKMPTWVNPPLFESYRLEWFEPAKCSEGGLAVACTWRNICSRASTNPDGIPGENTVLVDGDVIDAVAKTIDATVRPDKFNFGCAGHSISKLMLTAHVNFAPAYGYPPLTNLQRQTMLKLLTASYTSSGRPYTQPGTAVRYADLEQTLHLDDPGEILLGTTLEARWGPNGATCINGTSATNNHLRRSDAYQAMIDYGEVIPPPCSNTSTSYFGTNHLISATLNTLNPFYF
jgi:hypothetical protein